MPKIGNGRVANDGTGSVSFVTDGQSISGMPGTTMTALTVTGNSDGGGSPIFLGQNSNIGNVVLNFASLVGGSNVSLDTTTSPGEIIINSAGGGGGGGVNKFIQLIDGPQDYSNRSLLYSTSSGIAWTIAPSGANQFLYWTGSAFAFTTNVITVLPTLTVTSSRLTVTGSPLTGTGTIDIELPATGVTAGTYNQVTVDAYGRVISARTITGTNGTVTNVGISTTTLVVANSPITTAGTINVNLASVVTPGTYTSVVVDAYGRVISGSSGGGGNTSFLVEEDGSSEFIFEDGSGALLTESSS